MVDAVSAPQLLFACVLLLSGCGSLFLEEVPLDASDVQPGADAASVEAGPRVDAPSVDAMDARTSDSALSDSGAADSSPAFDTRGVDVRDAGTCATAGLRIAPDFNSADPLILDLNPGDPAVGFGFDPVQFAPGGRFIVALQSTPAGMGQVSLLSFNFDGGRDPSFGMLGQADLGIFGTPHSIIASGDGGWLITASDGSDPVIMKVDARGVLDPSFGVAGSIRPVPGMATRTSPNTIDAVAGGFLIGGQAQAAQTSFWNTLIEPESGDLRTSFGVAGHAIVTLVGNDEFGGVEPSFDPMFYYNAGSTYVDAAHSFDCAITRMHIDGSLDESFGDVGWATVDVAGESSACPYLVETPSWIYAGGRLGSGNDAHAAIFRFNHGGELDSSFGNNGVLVLFPAEIGRIRDLAVFSDGAFIAVGQTGSGDTQAFASLLRGDGSMIGSPARFDGSMGDDQFQSVLIRGDRALVYGSTDVDIGGNALVLIGYERCD